MLFTHDTKSLLESNTFWSEAELLSQVSVGDRRHQEYEVKPQDFADQLAESYGDDGAADVPPLLTR